MAGQNSNTYEDTFYIIPRRIRKLPGMTLALLDFYETCFQFWNKNKSCFLKNAVIKKRTGIKSDATINDAFKYFEKNNVLKREIVNGQRHIVPIFSDVEIEEGVSPQREGGIGVARGGVSPQRDINKEVLNKEKIERKITPSKKATSSLVCKENNLSNESLIEAFINEFPEHPHPNPKKLNKELVGALNSLKRAWPSDISPSGKELTVETWVQYLKNLKEVNHWMTNPEKNVSMITFCRIKTVQEAISIFNAYERRKNKEKYV